MLGITDLKIGAKIQIENVPYSITWNRYSKQARGAGVMKTKLKNLLTGGVVEKTFQGAEKVEPAEISFRRVQFLYSSGNDYEFMDQETFEQISFQKDRLGEIAYFLIDGMDADIQYFDEKPINVQVAPKLKFKVTATDPGVKGDTATGGTKPATIETGYIVKQVPLFINIGDTIIINTDSGEYIERAKK